VGFVGGVTKGAKGEYKPKLHSYNLCHCCTIYENLKWSNYFLCELPFYFKRLFGACAKSLGLNFDIFHMSHHSFLVAC